MTYELEKMCFNGCAAGWESRTSLPLARLKSRTLVMCVARIFLESPLIGIKGNYNRAMHMTRRKD
ncbi:hypothetical protein QUB08_29295 [Microcoleus sp. BR0-C5]|uniref:hypothetical protein n=1 Tax=Microcoleus sp. BR0-C5 TaxID=2818713 RepID=UPI002FD0554C